MVQYRKNIPTNAEITIDYKKKKVDFNYPNKNIKPNVLYFGNNFYQMVGFGWGAISFVIFYESIKPQFLNLALYFPSFSILTFFVLAFVHIYVGKILFGYISLGIHKLSANARKYYPETNAILVQLRSKRKIDLSRKYSMRHIISGKKLFILDYCIMNFSFWYQGKNKIIKIETKSIEKPNHKGEHNEFIAIIHFKNQIKEGIFKYR